jgi:nitrous oxidase accessory protein NosD
MIGHVLRPTAIAVTALLCASSLVGTARAAGATHYVSTSPLVGLDNSCTFPEYNSIQLAVDASNPGDTIVVCDGTYTEQVTVTKNLTLAGSGNAIIQAPATLVADTAGKKNVVEVNGGASVTMSGFTVAGPGPSGCGSIDTGIAVLGNANLDLSNTTVRDIRDDPLSGCQNGEGIRVGTPRYATTADVGHATINNVSTVDYQKNGIVIAGAGSTGKITNATVTGNGKTPALAENGIEVVDGAAATISTSTIRDNFYTGLQKAKACGLLIIAASGVNDSNNVYLNDQQNKCTASGRGGTYQG